MKGSAAVGRSQAGGCGGRAGPNQSGVGSCRNDQAPSVSVIACLADGSRMYHRSLCAHRGAGARVCRIVKMAPRLETRCSVSRVRGRGQVSSQVTETDGVTSETWRKSLDLTCSGSANLKAALASASGRGCAGCAMGLAMAGLYRAGRRTLRKTANKNVQAC